MEMCVFLGQTGSSMVINSRSNEATAKLSLPHRFRSTQPDIEMHYSHLLAANSMLCRAQHRTDIHLPTWRLFHSFFRWKTEHSMDGLFVNAESPIGKSCSSDDDDDGARTWTYTTRRFMICNLASLKMALSWLLFDWANNAEPTVAQEKKPWYSVQWRQWQRCRGITIS